MRIFETTSVRHRPQEYPPHRLPLVLAVRDRRWLATLIALSGLPLRELAEPTGNPNSRPEFHRWPASATSGGCGAVTMKLTTLRKRSEEHTSELQSRGHLVCRLLLE